MTATKERPITFRGDMVKAILDGRKTMTRRVVKNPNPRYYLRGPNEGSPVNRDELWLCEWDGDEHMGMQLHQGTLRCPYGKPGDRLYVKETWQTGKELDDKNATEIKESTMDCGYSNPPFCPIWYPINGEYIQWCADDIGVFGEPGRKRTGRFAPRWASRITLEIEDVWVERVKDISEDDAGAEGCSMEWYSMNPDDGAWPCPTCRGLGLYQTLGPDLGVMEVDCLDCDTQVKMFRHLWDSINAKSGNGWDKNDRVWALTLRRVD